MGFLLAESYTMTLISGAFKASVGMMLLQTSVKSAEWPEKMWHLITSWRWEEEIIIFICNICYSIWLNLISLKPFKYPNCRLHMTLLKISLWCYVSCRVKYNECQIRGTTPSLGCYFQCNIYFCIRSMFVSYIFLSLSCKYIVHHCDDCKFC